MSLLDAFLEDGLAASVLAVSDVWFAIRKDGAAGLGTQEDPFDGSTAAHFDAAMASLSNRTNLTIHLGPSGTGYEFKTAGGTAWQPQSGWRLVGAGMDATTLKVENILTGKNLVAIGNPTSNTDPTPLQSLDGFEASDFTIDCNGAGTAPNDSSVGGISVTGRHIRMRRLRVLRLGGRRNGICVALSAAWAASGLAVPEDCVIEECQVGEPYAEYDAAGSLVAFQLGRASSAAPKHLGCIIRNCLVDPDDAAFAYDIRAFMISGGDGTIVEGNHVRNCSGSGPSLSDEAISSGDLILRNNVFSKVQNGPTIALHSGTTVGRLLVQGNWIELGASGSVSGIRLSAANSGFTSVILRGNIIRYATAPGTIPTTDAGINLSGCASAIVENNIIDVGTPDHAILHGSTDGVHLFNNQTSGGVFRPGFDGTLHDQELTTEVEDVLLGLLMR